MPENVKPAGSNISPTRFTGMALVELGRFNRNEAHFVMGRLESEGIPAIAFDGEASIGDGSYFLIPVRVMVDDGDIASARAIIADPA